MRSKFMVMISAVLVLVMFAGSTLAFAEPIRDVPLEQFTALRQGVQAEPLSNVELEQIRGSKVSIDWKLVSDLASLWGKIIQAMAVAPANPPKALFMALKAAGTSVGKAYWDYRNAKISAAEALKIQNQANKALSDYLKAKK